MDRRWLAVQDGKPVQVRKSLRPRPTSSKSYSNSRPTSSSYYRYGPAATPVATAPVVFPGRSREKRYSSHTTSYNSYRSSSSERESFRQEPPWIKLRKLMFNF